MKRPSWSGDAKLVGSVSLPGIDLRSKGYSAYMMVQHASGPQYLVYQPAMLLHIGLFVLGGALMIRAWHLIDVDCLPHMSESYVLTR